MTKDTAANSSQDMMGVEIIATLRSTKEWRSGDSVVMDAWSVVDVGAGQKRYDPEWYLHLMEIQKYVNLGLVKITDSGVPRSYRCGLAHCQRGLILNPTQQRSRASENWYVLQNVWRCDEIVT